MNATLLCPGPSLSGYGGQGAGMVVGVNRAATAYPCDVWAATDRPLIMSTASQVIGDPVLYTIEATLESLRRRGRDWPHSVVTHTEVTGGTVTNHHQPWTRYTTTAALRYLAWMGATHIDVWGCDWAGDEDWDGKRLASNSRTAERWREEQEIWSRVVKETGILVERHTADQWV